MSVFATSFAARTWNKCTRRRLYVSIQLSTVFNSNYWTCG